MSQMAIMFDALPGHLLPIVNVIVRKGARIETEEVDILFMTS